MKAILIVLLLCCAEASALDRIVLVRHAEKEAGWPAARELNAMQPLSAAGLARAEKLAELLADEPLLAVYASPTTRSMHTGLPTARAHALELQVSEASVRSEQMGEFLSSLRQSHPESGSVLIVGHSNTVPLLLRALGAGENCDTSLGIVPESYGPSIEGYDGIWRVDLSESGCEAVSWATQSESP